MTFTHRQERINANGGAQCELSANLHTRSGSSLQEMEKSHTAYPGPAGERFAPICAPRNTIKPYGGSIMPRKTQHLMRSICAITMMVMILSPILPVFTADVGSASQQETTAAFWHFDEGEGQSAQDSSLNANHGLINGAVWTEGKQGLALDFDGKNDYVSVPDSDSLDLSEEITIACWIKTDMGEADR